MSAAVIVASSRTGLAKSFRGSFNITRPDDLAAHCVKDLLKMTKLSEVFQIFVDENLALAAAKQL